MNLKIIAVILVSLLVGAFGGFYFTVTDNISSRINSDLSALGFTLDALEYFDHNMENDIALREKLEIDVISNLLITERAKPKLTELQGAPLSNLCRVVTYKKKNGFGANKAMLKINNPITKLVTQYLTSIEIDLKKIANESIAVRECKY